MSSNTKYMDHKKVGLGKNNFKENFQLDFIKKVNIVEKKKN